LNSKISDETKGGANTQTGSTPEGSGVEMEFEDGGHVSSGETPKPPPLQDAREYYNNT